MCKTKKTPKKTPKKKVRKKPTAPNVSFNQWLRMQKAPGAAHKGLAEKWVTARGRLTRDSILAKGVRSGLTMPEVRQAYDDYLQAIGLTSAPN